MRCYGHNINKRLRVFVSLMLQCKCLRMCVCEMQQFQRNSIFIQNFYCKMYIQCLQLNRKCVCASICNVANRKIENFRFSDTYTEIAMNLYYVQLWTPLHNQIHVSIGIGISEVLRFSMFDHIKSDGCIKSRLNFNSTV